MVNRTSSVPVTGRSRLDPPAWITGSPLLAKAHSLAASAHGSQRRATDERYFLEHVMEVAELLQEAGFEDEIVAVGLLHDSVERGSLGEKELRDEMGARIASLVLTLSEDPRIRSFDQRKAGLRRQVEAAGGAVVAVYGADKLSDIGGLQRGIKTSSRGLEQRMGTSVAKMQAHYRDSVEMIESVEPDSVFLQPLRAELDRLEADVRTQSKRLARATGYQAVQPLHRDRKPS